MEYRQIPYVRSMSSRIVFGLASPLFWDGQDAAELLNAAYEAGINTFDTARVYGKSERTFGKWMAENHIRNKVIIVSKCGHPDLTTWEKRVNEKEMRKDLEKSLQELQTDFIDVYLLHRDDPQKDVGELVETFNAMHTEGKIGAFGGSNWTHQRIAEANEYAYKHNLIPFSVSSPNFCLAERVTDMMGDCISITGPSQEDARTWYRDSQMPIIAYASLAQGLLSGKMKNTQADHAEELVGKFAAKGYGCSDNYERLRRCEELAEQKHCAVSQIALAWVLKQKLNTFAVVGASNISRIQSNIEALNIELSTDEILYLDLRKTNFDCSLSGKTEYKFYGWETADIKDASGLTPRDYYDILSEIWCAGTCAPRMRDKWNVLNPTLGQCSITAFLMQDIYGGKVCGILRSGGYYHCFNVVGDCVFDLTSEQFGNEDLDYNNCSEQSREAHFSKEEKRLRYEYLRAQLLDRHPSIRPCIMDSYDLLRQNQGEP